MARSDRKKLSGFPFKPSGAEDNPEKIRIVGNIPSKEAMNVLSKESHLKNRDAITNKSLAHHAFFPDKRTSPRRYSEIFAQKQQPMQRFVFVSARKDKLTRHKTLSQLVGEKTLRGEQAKRLSAAERLRLFQALSEEPLTFLDLHTRFGVSKRMMEGLVEKGLSMEVWGPRAIGVRFKLTNKGKKHLKELEAAAEFKPRIRERRLIQLKTKAPHLP
jgi:hypothetical protein